MVHSLYCSQDLTTYLMTVSLIQWRAVIGIFNYRSSVMSNQVNNLTKNFISMFEMLLFCWHYFESAFIYLLISLYLFTFLPRHGDIELNPGPRKEKKNSLSVCHWILNSLSAHNFSKLTQLKHIMRFTNMISFAYQKTIWILQFLIMYLI